ncbi:MAG: helicase associated domain-containing protein [Bacteroidales bacterium]|nr:helicase associated domain-containing protein [Bacteroidales bacterium]
MIKKNSLKDEYWEEMIKRMKAYQKKFGTSVVSRGYEDKELYTWYRNLKNQYRKQTLDLSETQIKQLESINFYWGDGHEIRYRKIDDRWLNLLEDAIKNGEDVKCNHRYLYKGQHLGTFLVQVAKYNKMGKKLDTRERIESIGFIFSQTSREPHFVVKRFLSDLKEAEVSRKMKQNFQNRFRKYILTKRERLTKKEIQQINKLWMEKFSEERVWGIKDYNAERIIEWKAYRYDKKINPEKRWYPVQSRAQSLYTYLYRIKPNKYAMANLQKHFSKKELLEMQKEGFAIDFDLPNKLNELEKKN